jgi:hypothetical protein
LRSEEPSGLYKGLFNPRVATIPGRPTLASLAVLETYHIDTNRYRGSVRCFYTQRHRLWYDHHGLAHRSPRSSGHTQALLPRALHDDQCYVAGRNDRSQAIRTDGLHHICVLELFRLRSLRQEARFTNCPCQEGDPQREPRRLHVSTSLLNLHATLGN